MENVLYPRIKVNPNFKKVLEILKDQGYISKTHGKRDSIIIADTNAGYCRRMALIDISSNLYGVVASLQLLLEKIKVAEIVSVGITDTSIENTAKGIAAAQGLGGNADYTVLLFTGNLFPVDRRSGKLGKPDDRLFCWGRRT